MCPGQEDGAEAMQDKGRMAVRSPANNMHLIQYTPPNIKAPPQKRGERVTKQDVRCSLEVRIGAAGKVSR